MAGSAWTNELVSLIILAANEAGFSGFFAYSPAPGPGKLVASFASTSGTDPYGNPYTGPGFATYSTGGAVGLFSATTLALSAGGGQLIPGMLSTFAEGGMALVSGEVSGGDVEAQIRVLSAQNQGSTSTIELLAGQTFLNGSAAQAVPTAGPAITGLGSTWNATTAAQCNGNFTNIVNFLTSIGLI